MKILQFALFATFLTLSMATLSACENTYKGLGHDIGNEEMKDGWE